MTEISTERRQQRLKLALGALLSLLAAWYVWVGIVSGGQSVEAKLAPMPLPRGGETVLVFAPHEDDETLGAAIYMRRAVAAGAHVYVCLMTAGEGEELGAALYYKRSPLHPRGFVKLGQAREQESLRALARIGLPPSHVLFLNYPNDGLQPMWSASNWSKVSPWVSPFTQTAHSPFAGNQAPDASFCGASALQDVKAVLQRVQPTEIFTVHPADIHRDHWTTYCFVKLALEDLAHQERPQWLKGCHLYTYLVHRRGWPVPWGYYPDLTVMPPASLVDLPINRWLGLHLADDDVTLKNAMILTYRSQMARFDMLLRSFSRQTEIYADLEDITLAGGDLSSRGVFLEPTADSHFLRLRPEADVLQVDLQADGANLHVKVRTAAPLGRSVRLYALIHVVNPAPGAPRVLRVDYVPGQAPAVSVADDDSGPTAVSSTIATAINAGDTTTFTLPYSALGDGRPVMVDVLTQIGRVTADHSITRMVFLPRSETAAATSKNPQKEDAQAKRDVNG